MAPLLESSARRIAKRRGILALVALAFAWATVMQALGWAQTSQYALVRAFSHGTAEIDAYQWETRDKSYYRDHYYSVKAPGLALLTLPVFEALKVTGGRGLSREMSRNAHRSGAFRWYRAGVPTKDQYGSNVARGLRVRADIESYTPLVWMLGLVGTVIPALLLLLLVRAGAERIEPGMGTAAALALGAGTLVMPFATLFFSHLLSALLGFGAFMVLWRERTREPSLPLVAAAGLLAGLAITTEYPLGIVAAALGVYALSRTGLRDLATTAWRAIAYAAAALAGVAPLAAYNLWAFGSITHTSYADAVKKEGLTGHDVLGVNDSGFFGVGVPTPDAMFDLLLSSKGLLVLSPVLAMGAVGTLLLYRRGRRAEALTISAITGAFLLYNSGYWLPFGGGSPGPRFLIPVLPFLALPLAIAWRRFPSTTLALAIPSALTMTAATVTLPMIGNGDTGYWVHLVGLGNFEHTIASALGADNGWLALSPFLIALGAAVVLAVRATPALDFSRDATLGAAAVLAWGVIAAIAPSRPIAEARGPAHDFLPLILVAVAGTLMILAAAVLLERRWAPPTTQTSDAAP